MEIERLDIYTYTYLEINKAYLAGAKITFYEYKSHINTVNSFCDSSGEIAHPNPMLADANGQFPKIYINKPYNVVIHNSTGKFVFEDGYE